MVKKQFEFPMRTVKAFIDESDGLKHVIAVASDNKLDLYQEYFDISALADMVKNCKSVKPNKPSEGLVDLMETHRETFGFGYATTGRINYSVERDEEDNLHDLYELYIDFALKEGWPQGQELYDEIKNNEVVKQLSVGGYIENWDENTEWETVTFEDDEGNEIQIPVLKIKHFNLEHVATTPEGWAVNPRTRFEDTTKSKNLGFMAHIYKSMADEDFQKASIATPSLRLEKGAVPKHSTPVSDKDSWDASAAREALKKWASSDGSGDKDTVDWSKYSKGFGWFDGEDKENFGSYKLPHHTVEDGTLKLVKSGLSAAMAALNGARGGTNISDSDREKVYNHLKKHYSDIDEEAPEFEKGKDGEDLLGTIMKALAKFFGERKTDMPKIEEAKSLVEKIKGLELTDEELKELNLSFVVESTEEETETSTEIPDVSAEIEKALQPVNETLEALKGKVEEDKYETVVKGLTESITNLTEKLDTALNEKDETIKGLITRIEGLENISQVSGDDPEDKDKSKDDPGVNVDSDNTDPKSVWEK